MESKTPSSGIVATIFNRLFILSLLILSSITILREVRDYTGWHRRPDSTWTQAIGSIVSPATADAIEADPVLRRNLLTVMDLTVDLSGALAGRYQLPELQEANEVLSNYRKQLGEEQGVGLSKRLFGIGEGSGGSGTEDPVLKGILDFFKPVVDTFKGIGASLLPDLNAPAFFLGLGIGEGTAQGLNLSTAATTKQTAQRIAKENNMDAGGLNGPIENLGLGLSGSLVGSLNLTALFGSNIDLPPVILSLAEGLGNGTAAGLRLGPNAAALAPPRDTSIPSIVGTFGFGLTKSITSNIDLDGAASGFDLEKLAKDLPLSQMALSLAQGIGNGTSTGFRWTKANLFPPMGSSLPDALGAFGFGLTNSVTRNLDPDALLPRGGIDPSLFPVLGRAALKVGEGLGNGTAVGLRLTNRTLAPNPDATDIPDVAGNFAYGLSKTLLENINTTAIAEQATAVNRTALVMKYLPAAAAGLGKGLGEGIPIGLGIQPDRDIPMNAMEDGDIDVETIAENFAKGLTSGVLRNGTLSKLMSSVGSEDNGFAPPGVGSPNLGPITQGLARGFVQGAGDAIDSLGGLDALMEGRAVPPPGGLPNTTIWFNDSVNGAANGFGQGFGGQVVLVAHMLLDKANKPTAALPFPTTTLVSPPAGAATPPPALVRRLDHVSGRPLTPRQNEVAPFDPTAGLNLSSLLSAETLSFIAQKGVEALSCRGVGGISLVMAGLATSGVIPSEALQGGGSSPPDFVKRAIPRGIVRVRNEGNVYEIDGARIGDNIDAGKGVSLDGALSVNGFSLPALTAFVVIHSKLGGSWAWKAANNPSSCWSCRLPQCPAACDWPRERQEASGPSQASACPAEGRSVGQPAVAVRRCAVIGSCRGVWGIDIREDETLPISSRSMSAILPCAVDTDQA